MSLPTGTVCALCGYAEGHSPRCSVTKFGAKEMRMSTDSERLREENASLERRWYEWKNEALQLRAVLRRVRVAVALGTYNQERDDVLAQIDGVLEQDEE